MKRILFLIIAFLISVNVFSQSFEGISGLKYLSSDTIDNGHTFIWRGDTIYFNNLWNKSQITVEDTTRWGNKYDYWGVGVNNGSSLLVQSHDPLSLFGLSDGILISRSGSNIYFKADTTLLSTKYYVDSKPTISLTTNETSGEATLINGVLNIPQYSGGAIFTPQNLSGTTISYNTANGSNANITLSGNTTINMSNVQAGMVGNITIINDGTARQLTFSGYTFKISLKIRGGTNMAWSSATGFDKFSWDYDGTRLTITGEYNVQ